MKIFINLTFIIIILQLQRSEEVIYMWIKFILIIGITSWMLIIIHSTLNLLEKRFEKIVDKKLGIPSSN